MQVLQLVVREIGPSWDYQQAASHKVENYQILKGNWGEKTAIKRETSQSKKGAVAVDTSCHNAVISLAAISAHYFRPPCSQTVQHIWQLRFSRSQCFGCKVVCLRWYTRGARLGTFPPLPFIPDSLWKNKMKIQIEWGCPAFFIIDCCSLVYPAVLLCLKRSLHFINVLLPYFLDMFTSWTVNFKGWSLFCMADWNCFQFECPKRSTQKQTNKHDTMDATF